MGTKAARGGGRCVCGGRLRGCGKSKRSKAPPDGHRSDSTGIVYQFPSQRSSDSGFVTLRLSRPPWLRDAKIFSRFSRCPPYTPPICPGLLSGLWRRKNISLLVASWTQHSSKHPITIRYSQHSFYTGSTTFYKLPMYLHFCYEVTFVKR